MIGGGKYHPLNFKNAYNRKKAYRIKKARAITYKFWNNPGILSKAQKNTPKSKFRRIAGGGYMRYHNL